ncbi:hypothetical protein PRNP1_013708 [Phytophthora ramorum]
MNVWALDNEPVASRPQRKKTCFANEVEVVSTSGWGDNTLSQRRKQQGKVEFLVEDQQTSDDDEDEDDHRKGFSGVPKATSLKTDEISTADIVDRAVDAHELAPTSSSKQERQLPREQTHAKSNLDITVHHLVREFLLMHSHEDVVKILDHERPMPMLGAADIKQLSRRLVGKEESRVDSTSLLERFLVCSNEAKLKARAKRGTKDRSASTEKKSRTKSSPSGRQKPVLNVITSNLDRIAVTAANTTPLGGDQTVCDYNRLGHPGSTPHHQTHGAVIGEPGSTPMARAKDLRRLGFEALDDDGEKAPNSAFTNGTKGDEDIENASTDHISQYALRKRTSKTGLKRVQLGDPGSTPTKEYIFFRETPPSFVTETIEDAVEVFEKLGSDPEFVKQAAVVDRYIELRSSEVSKYSVGQAVDGLGPQSNVRGVVSKIYGSRLCGTAGPGTIILDTTPERSAADNDSCFG